MYANDKRNDYIYESLYTLYSCMRKCLLRDSMILDGCICKFGNAFLNRKFIYAFSSLNSEFLGIISAKKHKDFQIKTLS